MIEPKAGGISGKEPRICADRGLTPFLRNVNHRQSMKTKDQASSGPIAVAEDDLLRLEMQIAQRADQLWQDNGKARGNDLEHWLQAEREILARIPAPA